MASAPTLIVGGRGDTFLYEHRLGTGDGPAGNSMFIRSHRFAPAGAGGLAIFRALYIATRHQRQNGVLVTAWIDDVQVLADKQVVLPERDTYVSSTIEVALSVPVLVEGVEQARTRPQGVWIQVQIDSPATVALAIDGVDVEWEAVQRRF